MALAAVPLFYGTVSFLLARAVLLFGIVLISWALIHAATRRAEAYAALGGLQKHQWLAVLAALGIFGVLFAYFVGITIFLYVGIGAAAYYLLETRRGIKDVTEGSW